MTEEKTKRIELRDVAVMLPVGIACAFCVAVAHLYGELIGSGNTGLSRLLTFSDYVNLAVPIVALLLVATLVALICIGTIAPRMIESVVRIAKLGMGSRVARREPTRNELWRMGIVGAILAGACAIAVFLGGASLSTILLNVLMITLLVIFVALASFVGRPHLSDKALGAITVFLFLIVIGGLTGYSDALDLPRCSYTITVGNGEPVTPLRLYSIERGLALAWPGRFDLIAWENAKTLRAQNSCYKAS